MSNVSPLSMSRARDAAQSLPAHQRCRRLRVVGQHRPVRIGRPWQTPASVDRHRSSDSRATPLLTPRSEWLPRTSRDIRRRPRCGRQEAGEPVRGRRCDRVRRTRRWPAPPFSAIGFLVSDAPVGIAKASGATQRGAMRAKARRSRIDSRIRRKSADCRYRSPP